MHLGKMVVNKTNLSTVKEVFFLVVKGYLDLLFSNMYLANRSAGLFFILGKAGMVMPPDCILLITASVFALPALNLIIAPSAGL